MERDREISRMQMKMGDVSHRRCESRGGKTNMQNTPLQQRIGKANTIMEKLQGYNPTSSIIKKMANANKNHITIFLKETP